MIARQAAVPDWPAWYCPTHLEPLVRSNSALACPAGHAFEIRNGIPRFVAGDHYAEPWALQWDRYRSTQLDSYTGVPTTEARARRCIGDDLWTELAGKQVLECGCGAGRFTEVLLSRGACVTSIDASDAIEVNRESFPEGDRHRLAAADLMELPFAPRQFDVVFCLGVLQHTPNPTLAIARLYEQVKPGGWMVIDHYRYRLSWYTKTAPLFRGVLRRLPPETGLRVTERVVDLFLPLHVAARKSRAAQMAVSRISPVVTFYQTHPELPDAVQREWALNDTHDSLTDRYKHRRSRRQIQRLLEDIGMVDIWCARGGNGIEARGRRPAL